VAEGGFLLCDELLYGWVWWRDSGCQGSPAGVDVLVGLAGYPGVMVGANWVVR
jgi:hypothetical protein